MKCYKCGHDVPDGNEYCQFCGLKLSKNKMQSVIDEIMPDDDSAGNIENSITVDSESTIGNVIKVFSVILMIISIVGAFVLSKTFSVGVSIGVAVVDLLIFMVCYGIGEICCLLKSIDAKLK